MRKYLHQFQYKHKNKPIHHNINAIAIAYLWYTI
jgi:hypothetical protein